MTAKTDPSTKPVRARLNKEIITLKKGMVLEGVKIMGLRAKKCRKKDPQTGMALLDKDNKPVWEDVSIVDFEDKRGVSVSHFLNGGLKNALDGIPQNKFLDIECLGKKEISGPNGQPQQVNDYAVYEAQA